MRVRTAFLIVSLLFIIFQLYTYDGQAVETDHHAKHIAEEEAENGEDKEEPGEKSKKEKTRGELLQERMQLFDKYEALTLVPWYYLAAIDQYERNVQQTRNDLQVRDSTIAIQIPLDKWSGTLNPNPEDHIPETIDFFNGIGLDGDGDGFASVDDDEDVLYTMSNWIRHYGLTKADFRIALWEYYGRDQTVNSISDMADIYRHFGTLDLDKHAFPLALEYNYSYHSTWGDSRGWGGRRIHEGTDLFANYGTPVRSTTYGKIVIKGWNRYGGWRIGIRDIDNNYHYYAHLARYEEDVEKGDIVEPGTVIGYVGSTGYGKEGTSGKFPPHLHYGIYKDNGRTEWSYDPYPHLRLWEKEEKKRIREGA